jgi:hypothetical protein
MYLRNVVLPVPAFPVKKILREVLFTSSAARVKTELDTSGVCIGIEDNYKTD